MAFADPQAEREVAGESRARRAPGEWASDAPRNLVLCVLSLPSQWDMEWTCLGEGMCRFGSGESSWLVGR